MFQAKRLFSALILCALLLPVAAQAIVEPKTETEYPDEMTVNGQDLVVTGVALREKTFLKVDVYTIVSYVKKGSVLGEDKAQGILDLEEPKMIQMDLTRGFSNKKLKNAFSEVIEKNYDDTSAFQSDMDTFLNYFTADAQEGDKLIFGFCPAEGLKVSLNGEELGMIDNPAFMKALWTVWFGKEPADKGMREKLTAAYK